MKDIFRDIGGAVAFLARSNVSIATGQVLRIVLRHCSDQTRNLILLEVLQNGPLMQMVVPQVIGGMMPPPDAFLDESCDCHGDCEECDDCADETPPDDKLH